MASGDAPLRGQLEDEDPPRSGIALGPSTDGSTDDGDLQVCVARPRKKVRMRAVALTVGRSAVSPAPLLEDQSDDVVEVAAWACGERGAEDLETLALLGKLVTDHSNPLVRESAVAALGAIGHPAGLDAILKATTDRVAVPRRGCSPWPIRGRVEAVLPSLAGRDCRLGRRRIAQ